ncbi:hypothetical protein BDV12DRAFT_168216 [Aspergillus spectabilis]
MEKCPPQRARYSLDLGRFTGVMIFIILRYLEYTFGPWTLERCSTCLSFLTPGLQC